MVRGKFLFSVAGLCVVSGLLLGCTGSSVSEPSGVSSSPVAPPTEPEGFLSAPGSPMPTNPDDPNYVEIVPPPTPEVTTTFGASKVVKLIEESWLNVPEEERVQVCKSFKENPDAVVDAYANMAQIKLEAASVNTGQVPDLDKDEYRKIYREFLTKKCD